MNLANRADIEKDNGSLNLIKLLDQSTKSIKLFLSKFLYKIQLAILLFLLFWAIENTYNHEWQKKSHK